MELREAVFSAATRDDVIEAVGRIYRDLHLQFELRKPICIVSGRCCRFEEYGHRLYVTTMELAAFVGPWNALAGADSLPAKMARWNGRGCPFQDRKLCTVHAIRPMGCRVFFCDSSSNDWQAEQYERFHGELRRLHDEMNVPYRYMEWRAALRELAGEV